MRLAASIIGYLCFAPFCSADIIYVDSSAFPNGDGRSWMTALNSLRSALNKAIAGDEIWVADGVYYPGKDGQRRRTFTLKDGVSLYGGFAGGEDSRVERDWGKHKSVLSGNIGDPDRNDDNIRRVVSAVGIESSTTLDGFTIRDGYNLGRSDERGRGAGLYIERSNIIIRNCRMLHNSGFGGGVWNHDGNPTVINCVIRRNLSRGITSYTGSISLLNCVIARNQARTDGGGFGNNSSNSRPVVRNCVFKHNQAVADGAGYYGWGSPLFENCVFQKNFSEGGIAGAMFLRSGRATITNCTIVGNKTTRHTAGISTFNDSNIPTITNCLIWGNKAPNGDPEWNQLLMDKGTINNSVVQHWTGRYGGEGNFDADPKFVGPGRKNLRLAHDSPCIDAGSDDAVTEATDLDGNPRILGARVDIGAYENLCADVLDLSVELVEATKDGGGGGGGGGGGRCVGESDGDGVCEPGEDCCLIATVTVNPNTMPPGSTVRVTFTPHDKNGDPLEPRVRRARIQSEGRGKATLPDCPAGRVRVCVEGCGEALCREVQCP